MPGLPVDSDAAREVARSFAASLSIDSSKLMATLLAMKADAWTVGLQDGLHHGNWSDAADIASTIDWDTWKPGHPVAASLLAGTGFDKLLKEAGIILRGIDDTIRQDIGDTLAEALEQGWGVDQTASALDLLLRNPARADLIAVTEINRAMTEASLAVYRQSGYASWDLLTAIDPCPICLAIKAGNPHPLSDQQRPPIHPRCRCAVTAHVD